MDIVAGISGLVLLMAILTDFPKRIMTNAAEAVYARSRRVSPREVQQLYRRHRRK